MDAQQPSRRDESPREEFRVLVASTAPVELGRLVARRGELAHHRERSNWSMASFDRVPDGDFDLSIVVCGNESEMPAALSLASALARRRDTTLVLAPGAIVGPETVVQGALVVAARGSSPFANLALLARAIIAPVLTESMVCVDWADLLTVLDDGTQATLVAGKGASPLAAIAALSTELEASAVPGFHGICGALSSQRGMTLQAYHAFLGAMRARTASGAYHVLTVPQHFGEGALACVLAITTPKRRSRAASTVPDPASDGSVDDLPAFLRNPS